MFKLTFAVLVAGLSLALATAKAVEPPLQNSLLDIIDKALAVHDYTTVLKYIDNSGLNYFGYPNASRAYVRGDILNDSRLYASSKTTVYPSTFRRSLQGAVTTESAEEDTDKWEKSGKRVHTYSRFTITYSNSRPIHLISLNLTVLNVPKSDNEDAVLLPATVVTPVPNPTPWEHGPGAAKNRDEQTFVPQNQTPAPMPIPTARIVVNQPRSTPIPAPTLIQYSSTGSSSASEAAPATPGFILLGLILFSYFLPTIIELCNGHPHKAGIILLNFFLGWTLVGWVVALVWAVSRATAARMRNKATELVDQHIQSLIRRRAQLVRKDVYGGVQREKWVREINYFIDNQLTPTLNARDRAALAQHKSSVVSMIDVQVQRAAQDIPLFAQFDDKMSPVDFELFCAEQLKQSGWDAQITKASRDQGVDVIAEKNGLRIVLQCKLYTRPVGNKAVQEAAAAKAHEKADYGIVVTNSGYTSAAEQLASTNDILLLHYRDLTKLDTLLSEISGTAFSRASS